MYTCHRCKQEVRDIRHLDVSCGVAASVYHECGIGGAFTEKSGIQSMLICKDCRGEFLSMMGKWFKDGYESHTILCISSDNLAGRIYDKILTLVDHTKVKLSLTNHDQWYPDRWVLRASCTEEALLGLRVFVQAFGGSAHNV